MHSASPQSYIAEIRHLLSDLKTAVLNTLPDRTSPRGNGPAADQTRESGDDAAAIGILCLEIQDILGRYRNDTLPSAEQGILSLTLKSIGEAVITLDEKGSIVLFNNAAEALTELSFREVAGKQVEDILQLFNENDHTERYGSFIERCLSAAEQKIERRCMIRSCSGKERIIAYKGAPIRERGEYRGAVVVLRDITDSSIQEEELLKIRKLESVGVLAGGIAHDFNNLLTGITTYLFMARMSVAGNNEACSLIIEAEKAAFKATTLTKQLLSFAKGGPSLKETASIKQLIQDTVGFCLSGSNADYRLALPDDLAPVEVDKGQIDQVLNNLILNAAQAMPEGGTVTISGENYIRGASSPETIPLLPGRYVKISVRDEGSGISQNHLKHIFDPYFTTKDKGSGLGLTTAYSIVKRHGGHIYVETDPGKGSVFIFFLPVSTRTGDKNDTGEDLLNKGTGKILIMDDDTIVRTVVDTLLKKAGYTPVCVSNGTQTLETYAEALSQGEPFTVTIMDLTIPGGMGGKETVKKLREIDPQARVIAFSGYSNDPIFTNFKDYGFNGVLSKPFSIEEFMQTISQVLKTPSPADLR
jgi:PAS domain S-box-containing protein